MIRQPVRGLGRWLRIVRLALALVTILSFQVCDGFAQGSLTPPGAPAPTFKTLSQVEPRTQVSAVTTPGNFLARFIITQPGSYYLTTNIVGESGKRGIQIEAGDVSLDLNGFSLVGVSNTLDAIYFPFPTTTNFMLRNGTIRGWGLSGTYFVGRNGSFEQLTFSGNNEGIRLGDGSRILGCTVNDNLRNGIRVAGNGCLVLNNNCAGNNTLSDSSSAGILVNGSNNRIEGNHVSGNALSGYGVRVDGSYNVVIRNSAIGTNSYSIGSQNIAGPLVTETGTVTNANPWANFSH